MQEKTAPLRAAVFRYSRKTAGVNPPPLSAGRGLKQPHLAASPRPSPTLPSPLLAYQMRCRVSPVLVVGRTLRWDHVSVTLHLFSSSLGLSISSVRQIKLKFKQIEFFLRQMKCVLKLLNSAIRILKANLRMIYNLIKLKCNLNVL